MYYVYLLKSTNYHRFYIGCTSVTPEIRLAQHNLGKTKSTRPYKPWKLMYSEQYDSKEKAYKREWHLKHPKGYIEKLNIIRQYGEVA